MVHIHAAAVLGWSLLRLTNAAGAGTKAEYDSGEVHRRIMGIKMVCAINA